jgi:hypothetical protein
VRTVTFVLALILATGSQLLGHHSFAAHYFEEQSVTIEGTLISFEYRAPHAWVHMSVTDASGVEQKYAAEWGNPNRLARDGMTRDTLKAGDRVLVTGSPGRTAGENRIHLKRIERPADGWRWRGRRR